MTSPPERPRASARRARSAPLFVASVLSLCACGRAGEGTPGAASGSASGSAGVVVTRSSESGVPVIEVRDRPAATVRPSASWASPAHQRLDGVWKPVKWDDHLARMKKQLEGSPDQKQKLTAIEATLGKVRFRFGPGWLEMELDSNKDRMRYELVRSSESELVLRNEGMPEGHPGQTYRFVEGGRVAVIDPDVGTIELARE